MVRSSFKLLWWCTAHKNNLATQSFSCSEQPAFRQKHWKVPNAKGGIIWHKHSTQHLRVPCQKNPVKTGQGTKIVSEKGTKAQAHLENNTGCFLPLLKIDQERGRVCVVNISSKRSSKLLVAVWKIRWAWKKKVTDHIFLSQRNQMLVPTTGGARARVDLHQFLLARMKVKKHHIYAFQHLALCKKGKSLMWL